jgi:hypothetical protein
MKGGVRKKEYSVFVISNFVTLPLIGWYFGGALPALIGLSVALMIDVFFPTWKYELTWNDIDLALNNIYEYGSNPCELCFRISDRKLYIYRDEQGDHQEESIRMAVRIPLKDWLDIYSKEEFSQLMKKFGYMGIYSKNRGPEAYVIFTSDGADDCKKILKTLIEKSVGGLRPDIYAQSVVNAKKNIWVDHSQAA